MTNTRRPLLGNWLARDWLLAAVVFVVLGAMYVATLLPGLGGTEDTPKFQYVGPALGTAHDPGYPLYMIASWAFSKLPIRTLAYRINLLSAFWGAGAGALVCLAIRRLNAPRLVAVSVAVGLGLGRAFWEHSTYAEVYTQACAFTAAALLALITWEQRGQERHLYVAVAAVSLAFGTHLITVGLVPICMWLVLTRYRWRVPPRVLVLSGVIVVLGVAQYGYVWIRTVQGARYVESRADSPGELLAVLRGRQFENQTFRESPLVVAQLRLPEIGRATAAEMGPLGYGPAVLGAVVLWRRQRRTAVLLLGAFVGPALLLANLGNVATAGILLPAVLSCWVLTGAGLAALWSASRDGSPLLRRAGRAAAAAIVVALLTAQVSANLAYNNRRHETYDTDYFADLFSRIRGTAAFLDEDYIVRHMLEYQRYVTGSRDVQSVIDRNPDLIRDLLSQRVPVYGFPRAVAALDGLIGARALTLSAASLDTRLASAPDGLIVAVAGWADPWPTLGAVGVRPRPGAVRGVVVAVKGSGPVVVTDPGFEGIVEIRRGERLGRTALTAPFDLRIEVHGREAEIAIDSNPVISTNSGLAVAEMGSGLEAAYELSPGNGLRPPLDMSRRSLYRVTDVVQDRVCTFTGGGVWTRLIDPGSGARLVGRVDNYGPFDTRWVVYLGSNDQLPVKLGAWGGPEQPTLDVESFATGSDEERLRRKVSEDQASVDSALFSASVVTRLAVKVNDLGQSSTFRLNLGGRPTMGWGWTLNDRADHPRRGAVCALPAEPLEPDAAFGQTSIYLGPGWDWLFGAGWEHADLNTAGFFRRVRGARSTVLLPIEQPDTITIRLSAEPENGAAGVAAAINGRQLASIGLHPGWNDLAWTVEPSSWRAGINEFSIEVRGVAATDPTLHVRRLALDWSAPDSRTLTSGQ